MQSLSGTEQENYNERINENDKKLYTWYRNQILRNYELPDSTEMDVQQAFRITEECSFRDNSKHKSIAARCTAPNHKVRKERSLC